VPVGRNYLRPGDTGDSVRALQQALNVFVAYQLEAEQPPPAYPPFLAEDGIYGPRTREMVEAVQTALGVNVDGLAGRETLTALTRYLEAYDLGRVWISPMRSEIEPVIYRVSEYANGLRETVGLPRLEILTEDASLWRSMAILFGGFLLLRWWGRGTVRASTFYPVRPALSGRRSVRMAR